MVRFSLIPGRVECPFRLPSPPVLRGRGEQDAAGQKYGAPRWPGDPFTFPRRLDLGAVAGAGRRGRRTVPQRAEQAAGTGADTRPETPQVNAPPEHAEGHADRVAVGHAGTQDATRRPQ